MKAIKINILLFVVSILTSCDCLQHVQGIVIDSETLLPINNVMVIKKEADRIIYTDSVGNFALMSMTGGLFGCPKIVLSFEKYGYEETTKKYRSCCRDSVVVILKRKVE